MKTFACLLPVCLLSFATEGAELTRAQSEFFEKQIRPILANNCYRCHSDDAKSLKANLYLDSKEGVLRGGESGPVIVPGKPGQSLLIQAIRHQGKIKMPPKTMLKEKDILALEKWVKMGAPAPREEEEPASLITREIDIEKGKKFWAFQPVKLPDIPKVQAKSDLDRLIKKKHTEKGLHAVSKAEPAKLLRRLYFDLIGLPPTLEQMADFQASHERNAEKAIEDVVDALLASSHFGERWGRHWLDVARYAESTGMERNCTYTQAWRYRDYVIQAFNEDKPFDQFIREQIAGDLLTTNDEEEAKNHIIATGFLAMGPKSLNERNTQQFNADVIDEQIDITTRAFMGLTVSCARCHDHKFDPIPTKDYYAIYGIFHSSKTHFGTDGTGNRQKSSFLPLGEDDGEQLQAIEDHRQRLKKIQKENTENKKRTTEIQKQIKKSKADDRMALQKELKELKAQKQKIAKRLKKLNTEKPEAKNKAMGIQDMPNPRDARIHLRGDVSRLGESIPRGYIQVVEVPNASPVNAEQSGRLELANWIADPANPLTARVIVNRIWKHLFGEGIVRTVDNFGKTGQAPDDPELLDYLATRMVANQWSIKKTIREIVLSETYQLASDHNEKNFQIDPENRFWWRAHHRRLDAEALRDAILALSGELDPKPVEGSRVTKLGNINLGRSTADLAKLNSPNPHRSVYHPIIRNNLPDSLKLFDFAAPSIIVGKRQVTTVPSQALYLMNSPFILKQSEQLADRIHKSGAETPKEKIEKAYQMILNRAPQKNEMPKLESYLASDQENLTSLCQILFASAEFRYIE